MSQEKDKKQSGNNVIDEWIRKTDEGAKGAPSADEILAEFERGDFSSVDPAFFERTREEWDQLVKDRYSKYQKKKKMRKPKKDKDINTVL
ncbi:MAG: hypothetical protein HYS98_05140 [Deltaproteobacteria bacterium]|nr:hypothetical protein [Deltaproteobacteria bacterium]